VSLRRNIPLGLRRTCSASPGSGSKPFRSLQAGRNGRRSEAPHRAEGSAGRWAVDRQAELMEQKGKAIWSRRLSEARAPPERRPDIRLACCRRLLEAKKQNAIGQASTPAPLGPSALAPTLGPCLSRRLRAASLALRRPAAAFGRPSVGARGNGGGLCLSSCLSTGAREQFGCRPAGPGHGRVLAEASHRPACPCGDDAFAHSIPERQAGRPAHAARRAAGTGAAVMILLGPLIRPQTMAI